MEAEVHSSKTAHVLAAAKSAGMSARQLYDAVHSGKVVTEKIGECQETGVHDKTQESVKKMASCVNKIAEFAQETQQSRLKSEKANQNYAGDLILAKKLLKYLEKQTDIKVEQQKFVEYSADENQKKTDLDMMLSSSPRAAGSVSPRMLQVADYFRSANANPAALMSMYTKEGPMGYQAPTPIGYQAAAPGFAPTAPWGNMAAMFTTNGQNFPMRPTGKGSLVGRRPNNLLETDTTETSSGTGGLQAKLDSEAERLEANDAIDLQGR